MKAGLNVAQGKALEPTVAYLATGKEGSFQYHGDIDLPNLLKAFQYKSARLLHQKYV